MVAEDAHFGAADAGALATLVALDGVGGHDSAPGGVGEHAAKHDELGADRRAGVAVAAELVDEPGDVVFADVG